MNLKGLAAQLEAQGVDPGYIQRFDWEKWILTLPSRWSLRDDHLNPMEVKSLVLYLLQEYLLVEEQERVTELKNELSTTKEALRVASNRSSMSLRI